MACKKYIYAAGDTSWVTTFMEGVEKSWKGLNQVTLTNYDTTVACSIEEGSILEVAGSLYIATSDCAIGTAGISTALQYIQAIGSTGGCVFAYDSVAPTWRDDYQGYYASAASATRVIGGCYYTRTSFTEKWVYGKPKDMNYTRASGSLRPIKTTTLEIGDWNMDATAYCVISHGLDLTEIVAFEVIVRSDDSATHQRRKLSDAESGNCAVGSTTVTMERYATPGIFDNATYDQTTYNRGWVVINREDGK